MTPEEEVLLARAAHSDQQWRVWLLPPRDQAIAALAAVGEPVTNFPDAVELAETLPAPSGGIVKASLEVTGDISLYPASGVVAVADGTRVGWIRYTGKAAGPTRFTGVAREGGDMGSFPIGATIDSRVLISDVLTRVTIEEAEELGKLGQPWASDWTARVEGVQFEARQLLPEATFLIEARFYEPTGGWSDWLLMARGFAAEGYGIEYDPATGERTWDGAIRSLSVYVARHTVTSRRYGEVPLDGASASASSSLGQPMSLEPAEYTTHAGNAQPGNVTDGNLRTLWISSNAPTRAADQPTIPPNPGYQEGQVLIQEVGVIPAAGAAALQWVTLVGRSLGALTDNYSLTIKHPTDSAQTSVMTPSGSAGWPPEPSDWYIPVPGGVTLNPPPTGQMGIILTNNAARFTQLFGTPAFPLYDWRTIEVNGAFPGRNVELPDDAAGLMLRWHIENLGVRGADFVAYGPDTVNIADLYFANDTAHGSTPHWSSADPVPLGGPGTSIRRVPVLTDTQSADDWEIDPAPVPGDPGIVADPAWIMIDVPTFAVETTEAMSAGGPLAGDSLGVTDATPLDGAGELYIGDERVAYTIDPASPLDSVIVTARNVGGTGTLTHASGTAVYQFVPAWNNLTNAESIGRLSLMRPNSPTTADGGPIRLAHAQVWAASFDDPALPGASGWETDWLGAAPLHVIAPGEGYREGSIHLALKGYPTDTPANRRYTKLLLRILHMRGNGRAKLNEWRLFRSRSLSVNNGEIGMGAVARALLEEVLDEDEIEVNDAFTFFGESIDATILSGPLASTLQTICEEALVVMRYTRDGRVTFHPAPHHPQSVPDMRLTLDGEAFRAQRMTRRDRLGEGAVVVTIENTTTGAIATARYPETRTTGQATEIVLRSASGLMLDPGRLARALYIGNQHRAHEMSATSAGLMPLVQAGDWLWVTDYTSGAATRIMSARVARVANASDGPSELTLNEWRPRG